MEGPDSGIVSSKKAPWTEAIWIVQKLRMHDYYYPPVLQLNYNKILNVLIGYNKIHLIFQSQSKYGLR